MDVSEQVDRVPVTILSGFLGSGKTTFLRHVLSVQPSTKFAIIQNEFGESTGIEEVNNFFEYR